MHGSKIDKTTTTPQQWALVSVLLADLGRERDCISYYGNGNACLKRPDGSVVHVSPSGWVLDSPSGWVLDSREVPKQITKPQSTFLGIREKKTRNRQTA
jgi:hypothetical protein